MFEVLSEKLSGIFKKLRGRGLLTEEEISTALREVRVALLEADVHFRVVKTIVERVREKAIREEVREGLEPGHQVLKIVWEELRRIMGETPQKIHLSPSPPTIVMLVGLQGSGKTTTAAKIARLFAREGRRILLVAADLKRAAAIEQITALGEQVGVKVWTPLGQEDPVISCGEAVSWARERGIDLVILDTAGRLHVDDEMMAELQEIKKRVSPHEILLVADAMTGQDALNSAGEFMAKIGLTGVILTKMEGDARGGALLSIREASGVPVVAIGVGEKVDDLEPFYPDRMASRILEMGDLVGLMERIEKAYSREEAEGLSEKMQSNSLTLEDFRDQLLQISRVGSIEKIFEMIPGGKKLRGMIGETLPGKEVHRVIAIINSMTQEERLQPRLINGSRRRRIAAGSGTTVPEVNRLLKQFVEAKRMMKRFAQRKGGGWPFSV